MIKNNFFEVIIIGGSYAGLSAAMALGRSLRKVLIIDSGKPCNEQTPHSHNFITQDGEKPADIALKAKEQVLNYKTVDFVNDLAVEGIKTNKGFVITTQLGDVYTAKKIIFATGVKDIMPTIKGFSDCWGISMIHCPYCHGYEFKNQKTGIMANGEKAFHLASLVRNLTDDLSILTSGKAKFDAEQLKRLKKNNIKIIETEISEIQHKNGFVENVIFNNGEVINFKGVYASLPFKQHTNIPVSLGCELTDNGYVKINNFQKTTVEGVFACGDNSVKMRSVANAVYSGNFTGAMVNMELVNENF